MVDDLDTSVCNTFVFIVYASHLNQCLMCSVSGS